MRPRRPLRRSSTSSPSSTDERRILLISGEPFGAEMSGPAVRALQLGRVLAAHGRVTLAGPEPSSPPPGVQFDHVAYKPHAPNALREPIARADVVIAQPQWPLVTSWMRDSGALLIFDLFVPETLEALERYRDRGARARLLMAFMRDRLGGAPPAGPPLFGVAPGPPGPSARA